jgi:riboflavin-specific deaminase-like protein
VLPEQGDLARLRRLLPPGERATADEVASGLRLGDLAPAERPYLVLNMVSSADGKATVDGRTKALGNPADRELFHHLRTQVDAVMVGAGTLRAERYGPMIRDARLRQKREDEGLEPDPLAVVVSGRLALASDLPLLQDSDSRVLVVTTAEAAIPEAEARVEYVRDPGPAVDLAAAMRTLRTEHGVRSVLCEGGPTLNSELFRAGVVDELFLSLTPLVVGGAGGITIVTGEQLPEPLGLELVWALESEGHLFLRLRVRR